MFQKTQFLILLSLFALCLGSCKNCLQCSNQVCKACQQNYELVSGSCKKIGLQAGPIVGIVIGCLVIGAVIVISLLCIIVWCSQTVEERVDIVETDTPSAYHLPPISKKQSISTSPPPTITKFNQQVVPQQPNSYITAFRNQTNNPLNQPMSYLQAQMYRNYLPQNKGICSICMHQNTNIRLHPCSHQFHVKCLSQWINKKGICPNCNSHNFVSLIKCNICGNFNQLVSFCPTGCQKPNHSECFVIRNQDKITCRNCVKNTVGLNYSTFNR